MNNIKSLIIGIVAALFVAAIIIYSLEKHASLIQVLIGFVLFVFPVIFISSFKSKVTAFLLALFIALFTYIIIKNSYHDVWLGVLLALIIGGSAFYFRVSKYKLFSPSKYNKESKNI